MNPQFPSDDFNGSFNADEFGSGGGGGGAANLDFYSNNSSFEDQWGRDTLNRAHTHLHPSLINCPLPL